MAKNVHFASEATARAMNVLPINNNELPSTRWIIRNTRVEDKRKRVKRKERGK
jgi:hypothetical protein